MPAPEQNPLHHLFAHNAWATTQLLSFCEQLTDDQLAATAPGAVGSVFDTLHHYIQAEGGYLSRLEPALVPGHWQPYLTKTIPAIRERAEEMARLWLAYAATDPDAAEIRRKAWPDVTHHYPAGMEIAQALFHSHIHREQACMIITSLGLEPPDLQPLAWGLASGVFKRIRPATPADAPAIAAVHLDSWRTAYANLMPPDFLDAMTLDEETARWTRGLAKDATRNRPTFLALSPTDQPLGYITVGPDPDAPTRGLVFLIYVAPAAWGDGTAEALMTSGLDALSALGYREAALWVLEANHRARRFYEKSGWLLTGDTTTSTYGDVTLAAVCYSLPLQPSTL